MNMAFEKRQQDINATGPRPSCRDLGELETETDMPGLGPRNRMKKHEIIDAQLTYLEQVLEGPCSTFE